MISFISLSWSFRNFPLPQNLPAQYNLTPHFSCPLPSVSTLQAGTALLTPITVHTLPYTNPALRSLAFFLDSWPLKMGPIDCPETSVSNCHHKLHNNLEKRSSHLLRGGSLISRMDEFVVVALVTWRAGLMRCIVLSSLDWQALQYFSTLSHKGNDFEKQNLLNVKCVFDFIYKFVENICHYEKKWTRLSKTCVYVYIYIYIYMYVACKVQSVILVTVQWNMNFLSRF